MANITSAGTGNSNAGATWTGGSVPTSSDNAIIQDGHTVTQNAAHTFKSLLVQTGGTWTADGSNHLTLSGENDSDFALQIVDGTYNHANGTVVINNGGGGIAHAAIEGGVGNSTTGLYDLTISGGGTTCEIYGTTTIHRNMEAGGATTVLRGALTVNGNLTIPATLNTQYSSTDRNITVVGDISVTGTLQGNASAISSRKLTSTGTLNGGNFTVTGAGLGNTIRTIDLGGTVTGNVDITLTGAGNNRHEDLQASGNIRNLTINNAAAVIHTGRNTTIDGDLTITAGTLSCDDSGTGVTLDVNGDVSVTGTLNGFDKAIEFGSLTIASGGTYSATTGTTTLTKDDTSQFIYETISGGTFTHNSGTLTITGDGRVKPRAGTGNFHNVTLNASGNTIEQSAVDVTIEGDLTITAGEWHTGTAGLGYSNLTVAGKTTVGPASGAADQATLNCHSGTISLGSGRQQADYAVNIEIGGTFTGGTGTHTFGALYMAQSANAKATMTTGVTTVNGTNTSANKAWRVEYGGATFDNNNGTVKFHLNGFSTRMSMRGASHANNAFHNLIIDADTSARQISPDNGTKIIVDDDLTITNGKLVMGLSHALEVGGDVNIDDASGTAELEMGSSSNISSQAVTFGSLTIGNSGTYKATSGTTTITSESSAGSAILNSGTFTHNKGTVAIDTDATTQANEGPYYNLKTTRASLDFYPNGALDIQNDLDIVGDFDFQNNSHHLTVRGNMTVGDGSTTTRYGQQSANTNNLTVEGLLTVLGSATADLGTHTTVNLGGIRNVGGTIN